MNENQVTPAKTIFNNSNLQTMLNNEIRKRTPVTSNSRSNHPNLVWLGEAKNHIMEHKPHNNGVCKKVENYLKKEYTRFPSDLRNKTSLSNVRNTHLPIPVFFQ